MKFIRFDGQGRAPLGLRMLWYPHGHLSRAGLIVKMITIAIQCCLATFELLFIATVFVLSRIYFLGALLIDVICMKTKKIFYRPFFPVKNAELPGRWDLEGWREFRIQYIEKIKSEKLLALNQEIKSVLKHRRVLIEENGEEQSLELLRRQLEDALGVGVMKKKTRPSLNLKDVAADFDFDSMEKDGKLIAISKAAELYRLLEAEEVDAMCEIEEDEYKSELPS